MPNYSGMWTMSQQFQARGQDLWPYPPAFWMGSLYGAGTATDTGYSVATDSAGNVYISGFSDNGAVDQAILAKYTPLGTLVWQKNLTGSSARGTAVVIDTADNIYMAGYYVGGSGGLDGFLAKYDTSGNLVWQQKLYTSSNDYVLCAAVDASGNIYLGGYTDQPGYGSAYVAKYNSSGSLQWSRLYYNTGSLPSYAYGIAVDSSSNVYLTGYYNNGDWRTFLVKYNSSGVFQWHTGFFSTSSYNSFAYGVGTDSSGNVYVTGRVNAPTAWQAYIFKHNSSGTLQWQKRLYTGSGDIYGTALSTDASGNSYITMANAVGSSGVGIAKYDTSGNLQWQRKLGTNGQDFWIYANTSGSMYIAGSAYVSSNNIFFAKLTSTGTLTGTYTVNGVSVVYSSTSYTDDTGVLALTTPIQADTAGPFASTTAAMTAGTSTLTSTVTQM